MLGWWAGKAQCCDGTGSRAGWWVAPLVLPAPMGITLLGFFQEIPDPSASQISLKVGNFSLSCRTRFER